MIRSLCKRLAPNEGDSEIVARNLKDGKEQRFGVGEPPRIDFSGPMVAMPAMSRDLAFSDDSQWLAMLVYPTVKKVKLLKKQRKPVQSKLLLFELATSKKTEFEKVRRFAFSGERSSAIALHRHGAAAPAAPPSPGAPPAEPVNMKDYTVRMREFFDHHLKGAPAPKWLEEGVPLLKMSDHLDERLKEQKETKPATPAPVPAS